MELRPYQREAVDAIVRGLASASSIGQLHAACGSGKTVIAQRAAEQLLPGDGLTVVLVPTLALVSQTLHTWTSEQRVPCQALAVCSDESVTDASTHTADLPIAVTTDPAAVAAWTGRGGRRLIVSTHTSALRVLAPAMHQAALRADLLICDEAHHLTGEPGIPIRRLADPGVLPADRRLYMTATPRINVLRAVRSEDPALSMDDTAVFGPVLYSYPFARAIVEQHLKDYRLLIVGIPDRDVYAMLTEDDMEYTDARGTDLRTLVAQVALSRACDEYDLRSVISFHPRIADAAHFTRTMPRHTPSGRPLTAHYVHGQMDIALRARLLHDLAHPPQDGCALVANARCLSEGVDVPAVDGVLFAHPKRSTVDIVQGVGRALRRSPATADIATVIIPIPLPETDGEIGDLDARKYDTLWHVVRALRAHDEPLGMNLDENRASFPHTDNPRLPAKITMSMPDGVPQAIVNQLRLLLVRQTTSPWWEGLAAARAHFAEHGHLQVPKDHRTPDGFNLWRWLSRQRTAYARGWLRPEHISELEKLGMLWEPFAHRFAQGLEAARAYRAEHGHLRVTQNYRTPDGFALGLWIHNRRRDRRAGRLARDRIAALDQLGMVWSPREASLEAARAYHAEHGHLNVPRSYTTADGFPLGAWLNDRRLEYRKGQLAPQMQKVLDELSIIWDPVRERQSRALEAARAYHAEHGHLNVPAGYTDNGVQLNVWLNSRRQDRRAGRLAPHIRQVLDELSFVWEPLKETFAQGMEAARAYRAEHGHLNVPRRHTTPDGFPLGTWLRNRRADHLRGRLTTEQAAAFEELDRTASSSESRRVPD